MREMYGQITAEFTGERLNALFEKHITGYDPLWFIVVAIRLFCAKEIILTIYAEDKLSQNSGLAKDKYPVKKFKKELRHTSEFFDFVQAFNLTVANPEYNIDDMEVMNR